MLKYAEDLNFRAPIRVKFPTKKFHLTLNFTFNLGS